MSRPKKPSLGNAALAGAICAMATKVYPHPMHSWWPPLIVGVVITWLSYAIQKW